MTPQTRRRLITVLVLIAVAGLFAYGFRPQPLPVETVAVNRAPLAVTVEEEGMTRVIDRFEISAPVAGWARRIELDAGDLVTRDQALVTLAPLASEVLDPRSRAAAEARVAAARAALEQAEKQVQAAAAAAEFADREQARLEELLTTGSTSRQALDRAETEARRLRAGQRSAEFGVEVARFELEAAKTALRYSAAEGEPFPRETVVIRAPVAGRVLKILRESAGVVTAGEALLEVGDTRQLEVAVDVLSAQAVRIRPGMPVRFSRWGGDEPLAGRVKRVEPGGFTKISALGVEEQRVWVIAEFLSPPGRWEPLGDRYRVEASFILWQGENVLQVPASALFRSGKEWAAFAAEDGRARLRRVQAGRRADFAVEVVSGLAQGERVIIHPEDAITDGVKIRTR